MRTLKPRHLHLHGPLLLLVGLLTAAENRAHFPILIHDADLGTAEGPVTITYAMGHPFELELEPAERPARLDLLDRRGRTTDLLPRLERTGFRGGTEAGAWQVRLDPGRGDHLLVLDSPPSIDTRRKTWYREHVKTWLHRGVQDQWDQRSGQPLEILPLTRPYGLRPGMLFSGRLLAGDRPIGNAVLYFERLNDRAPTPADLPPEPLITFVIKTDPEGRFTVGFPEPGWWVLGGYVNDLGTVEHEGVLHRHEAFAGIWLRVEP